MDEISDLEHVPMVSMRHLGQDLGLGARDSDLELNNHRTGFRLILETIYFLSKSLITSQQG